MANDYSILNTIYLLNYYLYTQTIIIILAVLLIFYYF